VRCGGRSRLLLLESRTKTARLESTGKLRANTN
jgi:hypothetical protein